MTDRELIAHLRYWRDLSKNMLVEQDPTLADVLTAAIERIKPADTKESAPQ